MTPFVSSVKKASRDVWLQLPPPVRQAAPYVGASVGTGILVFRIQQRRLDHAVSLQGNLSSYMQSLLCFATEFLDYAMQHAKNKALEQRLEVLTTERDDAKILAKELKVMHALFCMWSCNKAGVCVLPNSLQIIMCVAVHLPAICLTMFPFPPSIVFPDLQSQASRPQGASEMQMVAAVSQATRAAAEAATAAAGAAAICIIDPRNGTYTPVRAARKPSRRRQTKPVFSSSSEDGDQPMPSPT